jgi:hypothetical protein
MSDIFLKKDALNLLEKRHVVFFGDSSKLNHNPTTYIIILWSYVVYIMLITDVSQTVLQCEQLSFEQTMQKGTRSV